MDSNFPKSLADYLVDWRNDSSKDVWTVSGPEEKRLSELYYTMQGVGQVFIELISELIKAGFKEYSPQVNVIYDVTEWDVDTNAPKTPMSGAIGKTMKVRVENGKPNEYFVVAAATDLDSRPPYLIFLAKGGSKWSDGEWIALGVDSHAWDEIEDYGLFGNVDEKDQKVSDEQIEEIHENKDWWSQEGALAWALNITFHQVNNFSVLNWRQWPERFVPL